jgi:hypothetical protein
MCASVPEDTPAGEARQRTRAGAKRHKERAEGESSRTETENRQAGDKIHTGRDEEETKKRHVTWSSALEKGLLRVQPVHQVQVHGSRCWCRCCAGRQPAPAPAPALPAPAPAPATVHRGAGRQWERQCRHSRQEGGQSTRRAQASNTAAQAQKRQAADGSRQRCAVCVALPPQDGKGTHPRCRFQSQLPQKS